MAGSGGTSVPSLPPPRPKSPPQYPDLYGKRRELAKVQMLEREIGFLQEELKNVDGYPPASQPCREIADYIIGNADPLVLMTKKRRKHCRFWNSLCGISCFNISWTCCCGCSPHLKMRSCCVCDICSCKSWRQCSMPKCRCCVCRHIQCCKISRCSVNCCILKSLSCSDCSCKGCGCCCPRCPKVNHCCSCTKNCCYPCYLCY